MVVLRGPSVPNNVRIMSDWKRYWCWERLKAKEKRAVEDEMVRSHHWLSGHELEQTLRDSGGQGGMVCCSPCGCKESDTTEATQQQQQLKLCPSDLESYLPKLLKESKWRSSAQPRQELQLPTCWGQIKMCTWPAYCLQVPSAHAHLAPADRADPRLCHFKWQNSVR